MPLLGSVIRQRSSLFCSSKTHYLLLSKLNYASGYSVNLKEVLAAKIPEHNKKVAEFRERHNSTVIQDGIRFRGYTIPECQEKLPKAPGGAEPLPEAVWWLLCTGDIPDAEQVNAISKDWASRADLPTHVVSLLENFPIVLHPMSQFVAAIAEYGPP